VIVTGPHGPRGGLSASSFTPTEPGRGGSSVPLGPVPCLRDHRQLDYLFASLRPGRAGKGRISRRTLVHVGGGEFYEGQSRAIWVRPPQILLLHASSLNAETDLRLAREEATFVSLDRRSAGSPPGHVHVGRITGSIAGRSPRRPETVRVSEPGAFLPAVAR
jgi:hypothetical protein